MDSPNNKYTNWIKLTILYIKNIIKICIYIKFHGPVTWKESRPSGPGAWTPIAAPCRPLGERGGRFRRRWSGGKAIWFCSFPRAPGPPPFRRWLGWMPGGSNHRTWGDGPGALGIECWVILVSLVSWLVISGSSRVSFSRWSRVVQLGVDGWT